RCCLYPVGHRLLRRGISGPEEAQPIDEELLFEWCSADQPAIVELPRRERLRKPGLRAPQTRDIPLEDECGNNDPGPGGHALQPRRRLVRVSVEIASAARKRVQKRRAIAFIAAGEDVGRIRGPEEDP